MTSPENNGFKNRIHEVVKLNGQLIWPKLAHLTQTNSVCGLNPLAQYLELQSAKPQILTKKSWPYKTDSKQGPAEDIEYCLIVNFECNPNNSYLPHERIINGADIEQLVQILRVRTKGKEDNGNVSLYRLSSSTIFIIERWQSRVLIHSNYGQLTDNDISCNLLF